MPEVCLLLDDGVEGDDEGEGEEESAAHKPGIVRTFRLRYGDHGSDDFIRGA